MGSVLVLENMGLKKHLGLYKFCTLDTKQILRSGSQVQTEVTIKQNQSLWSNSS